ncbi:hypothetical protein SLEP1_g17942 [Rubroshorea leprosula]|uniref:CBM20 domain-containing protein n=1 Tax=Rubroshorea leprosula TaxID=152421 RepID=A0AAV5J4Z5_9ROSI|nr:hypothetical protein SLEP1_g17942 [Rubroshorea leprosula]
MVGDDSMFGLWDPESGIPMNWSEGHVWNVELDIPVGKSINFKFILKSSRGEIIWQPGQDRNLTTWESENTIIVCEDWENAQYQKIMEEKPLVEQHEESTLHSGMAIVTEKLTTPRKDMMSNEDQGSEVVDDNNYTARASLQATYNEVAADNGVPSPEKSIAIVADNISYPEEDFMANRNTDVFGDKDEPAHISNNSVIVAEEIVGDNGLAVTFKNPTPANMEGSLITHEGDPVLVPGLTTSSTLSSSEEGIQNEDEKNNMTDASIRVDEAKIHSMPEFDEKQEPEGSHQAKTTEIYSDDEQQLYNKLGHKLLQGREEQPDSEPLHDSVLENDIVTEISRDDEQQLDNKLGHKLLQGREEQPNSEPLHGVVLENDIITEISSDDEQQFDNQLGQKHLESKEEQPDSEHVHGNILENDINWGRKILEKLLENLRFL